MIRIALVAAALTALAACAPASLIFDLARCGLVQNDPARKCN